MMKSIEIIKSNKKVVIYMDKNKKIGGISMKKIKKTFPKMSKKMIALLIVFAMVLSYFIPLSSVFAEDGYVIYFTTNDNHEMENDGGHLKIDGQYVDLRDENDSTIGEVSCSNSKACTITVDNGTTGKLNFYSANKFTLYMQGHQFNMDHNFSANENIAVQVM